MLVYIAGSGAMGCRFGYQISKTNHDVILLDNWADHIMAIKENGLKVTGDTEDLVKLPIMKPTDATEEADLIILFTKAMQLPNMLQDIKKIIGKKTKVLCLLNGLGHEDVIRQYIPEHNILMGVTVWTAGLKGPGHAHLEGVGSVNLQSIDPNNQEAAHHYPSMHQDLVQNQRLTEIDFLNGAVNKKGENLGIDTPYCRLITQLIHTKENVLSIK
ncbi:TPA: 2-dehydropantoate 2-reductase [Streptococcus agalactiae]